MPTDRLEGKKVVLGVCGSIAAYKACELTRQLMGRGAEVRVIMTGSAAKLVAPLTFESLTGHNVAIDPFQDRADKHIEHIALADWADLLLIAPATANTMAKLAAGICDDMLTTTACACPAPVVIAPAMNPRMWAHPATVANATRLSEFGHVIVEPGEGEVACGHIGKGRLAPLPDILSLSEKALSERPLQGRRLLVSTGPTREAIDPIRYVTNRSSGKMGLAIAYEAWLAGADVVCVAGPVSTEVSYGPEVVQVETAAEMHAAVLDRAPDSDAYVAAAAVADFRPARVAPQKLKKSGTQSLDLSLKRTEDILTQVCQMPGRPRVVVGFAAETQDVEKSAARKLADKGCDLLVANRVGVGGVMGQDDTDAAILDGAGGRELVSGSKRAVARRLVERLAERLTKR